LVGSIRINEQWQECHEKGNRKGEVNGFEASDVLAILGTMVLNVFHVMKREMELS